MRVDVEKHLVIGPISSRTAFFEGAQELGIAQFIGKTSIETPQEIQNFIDALHVLRQMVPVKQAPSKDYTSANVLARHVNEHAAQLETLEEEKRIVEKEIARITPFGDFSFERVEKIEKDASRVFQFFFTKHGDQLPVTQQPELLHVNSSLGLDYYMSINKERTVYEGLIEMVFDKSLGQLRERLAVIHRDMDHHSTELAMLAHHKRLLKQGLIDVMNRHHLNTSLVKAQDHLDERVFAVESWVPHNKVPLLEKLASDTGVFLDQIEIEKKDRPPTYLENKGAARLGEDLVNIYDTPSKTDKDPSLWVFIAFGIFFAMIVADLGYGLLLFGISFWLYLKFGRKKGGALLRFTKLSMSLACGCMIWGIMLTSFFGIEFAPDSRLRDVSPINWMVKQKAAYLLEHKGKTYKDLIKDHPQLASATTPEQLLMGVQKKIEGGVKYVVYDTFQDNVLIELAIFIGTIHIILSFLRYLGRTWSGIGWITFMIGGYLYFPLVLGAISLIHYVFHVPYQLGGQIGIYLIFIGLGGAWVLAIIQHRLAGLAEIMHVIGVFADVMSYLRIYALSLAGMIMASTFDKIGTSMPLYIGIFIILAGHTINFVLALMGGVIHGLRLNFIEWYHYSFEGGGRQFRPLSLLKIE